MVQLYGHDVHASVTRPVAQLLGYRRVDLAPGASARVRFTVPPARLAFTARDGRRVVEPGELRLWVGTSSEDAAGARATTTLAGPVHEVGVHDERWTAVDVGA